MLARLQKIISTHGEMSRRKAEQLIAEGRVSVNGVTAVIGMSADDEIDEISIDDRPLKSRDRYIYIALNKPRGVITSASDDRGRKTVLDLLQDVPERVYPIGRLDYDSEGLLLLTNDGSIANRLMHPSGEKTKKYSVTVAGKHSGDKIRELSQPMTIDGYRIRPAIIKNIALSGENTCFDIIICEGRNRQIRKMCQLCGLEVIRLCRVEFAGICLGTLKPGNWRYLTDEEKRILGCGDMYD